MVGSGGGEDRDGVRWHEVRGRRVNGAPTVALTKAGLCCKGVADSSTSRKRVIGGDGEYSGSL